jgi:hypothetical protein
MKTIALVLASAFLATAAIVTPALADDPSCLTQATTKKLAGAALASFMDKCSRDTCTANADAKKLAGAARTSNMTKCIKDSCDARADNRKLSGAARDSFTKKCITDTTGT